MLDIRMQKIIKSKLDHEESDFLGNVSNSVLCFDNVIPTGLRTI